MHLSSLKKLTYLGARCFRALTKLMKHLEWFCRTTYSAQKISKRDPLKASPVLVRPDGHTEDPLFLKLLSSTKHTVCTFYIHGQKFLNSIHNLTTLADLSRVFLQNYDQENHFIINTDSPSHFCLNTWMMDVLLKLWNDIFPTSAKSFMQFCKSLSNWIHLNHVGTWSLTTRKKFPAVDVLHQESLQVCFMVISLWLHILFNTTTEWSRVLNWLAHLSHQSSSLFITGIQSLDSGHV